MADDIHINLEGDDASGGGSNEQYEDLARRMEELTEAMERARRSHQASQQRRDRLGRFSTDPNSARQRRRSGAGSGGSGGGSGGSGSGAGGQPNPASPNRGNKDSFFRIEGLFNLLKGGSNIRFRGIQNFTLQQVKDLFQKLQAQAAAAQATGGQASLAARAAQGAARLGTAAKSAGQALAKFAASSVGMATIAFGAVTFVVSKVILAMKALQERLAAFVKALERELETVNASVAYAQARANMSDVVSRVRTGRRVGDTVARQVSLNQELTNATRELNAALTELIAPLLRALTKAMTALTQASTKTVSVINDLGPVFYNLMFNALDIKGNIDRIKKVLEKWEQERKNEGSTQAGIRNILDGLKKSAENSLK